ncbi:pilus assembly protein CpaE [Novosphingobium panipatense]|jgi:pilus assembly protein CpaE|uniref:pilus assembly protein CpaE n=1 Tax=Novosphingobium TaxID=165696 RepID=UPI000CDB9B0B|nr:pilus assembly protein CpaE [Novosphingobium sp. HII-3]
MNAPWKSGGSAGRDQFASFMCDEASLEVLRPIVEEMGWQPEKCFKGGLRNAVQTLSVTASPNILLVDLSESGDPLSDINALAEVCEPGTVVVAVGQVNDVRLYRDLVASGIHDYLLKPLQPATVRDALAQAQAVFAAPRTVDPSAAKNHVAAAIIGTRGGVGASTLATSLAWLFSTDNKLATSLLDLDIHFGTGALTMDLEPGRGLTDAIENPSRIDGLFLERAMVRVNDHLAILSAEAPISSPLLTDGSAFVQLETEFRQAFEVTVLDLPRNMLINFPQLAPSLSVAVLVTELTLASARDTIRLLSWFKSQAPQARLIIVANKVQPNFTEISKADFEASIETPIDFTIPYDLKAASMAAKLGQTFAEANTATKGASVIREIAREIIDVGVDVVPPKPSLLGKFDLKAMMPRAKKKAQAPS